MEGLTDKSNTFLQNSSTIIGLFSKFSIGKTARNILFSMILLTSLTPMIVLFLSLTLAMRLVLKYYFVLFTNRKYRLMDPADSIWAYDVPASYSTMHSINICEGICDLKKIREKHADFVNQKIGDGRVCKKFKFKIANFFGYYCWKDCSATFDINKIVRFVNGDSSSTFCETEVFALMGKLFNEPIDLGSDQPQWEVLVVPNYIYTDPKRQGKRHYALITRMHHSYIDGIAFVQRCEKVIGENIVESALNPFKPINIPFYKKFQAYLNVFLLGPSSFYKVWTTNDNSFLNRGRLCGPKTVGWTKPIRFDVLKKIKIAKNTSIISILNCALSGTLRKLALKKQEQIPELIHGVLTAAKFPYEWMKPQNRFSLMTFPVNLTLDNVEDRLKAAHVTAKNLEKSPDFLMNYFMLRIVGLLPNLIHKLLPDEGKGTVLISNVPGPGSTLKMFDGDRLVDAGAWAPLKSCSGLVFTVYSYNGYIRTNVAFDGVVLTEQKDMDFIVQTFVEEIKEIGKLVGIPEEEVVFSH